MLHNSKLNNLQIDLLKSFQYINSKEEIDEINSLINFYLEKKLDDAIEKAETTRNYSSKIYDEWLLQKTHKRI